MGKFKKLFGPAWTWTRALFVRGGGDIWRVGAAGWWSFLSSLQTDKAPYVVTLFIAALGWTALRTSDRLQQTPFIEYRTAQEAIQQKGGAKYAVVQLRNVTTAHSFECFRLELVGPPNAFTSTPANLYFAYRGTVAARAKVELAQASNWRWEVRDFASGADILVGAPLQGNSAFQVMVRPCDAPAVAEAKDGGKDGAKVKPPAAPVLLERSLQTWYVEYELLLLWIGLLLWLVALVVINALKSTPKPVHVRRLAPSTFKR